MSGYADSQLGTTEYALGSDAAISDIMITAPTNGAVDQSPRPIVVFEIDTSEVINDERLTVLVGGIEVLANGNLDSQWTMESEAVDGVYQYTFTRFDGYFDPDEDVTVVVQYDNEDAEVDDVEATSSFTVIGAFATEDRVEYTTGRSRLRVFFNIEPGNNAKLYERDNYPIESLTGIKVPVQIKRIEFTEGNLYVDLYIAQRLVRFANYRLTVQNITDIYGREIQ